MYICNKKDQTLVEGGWAAGLNYGQMMVKLMMMFLKLLSNIVILFFYHRMLRSDVRGNYQSSTYI